MNSLETPTGGARRAYAPRVAICLTIVIIALLLVPLPKAGRAAMAVVDSLHAPVFALFSVVVFYGLRPSWLRNRWIRALLVWVALVLLGGAMEVAQSYVGRGASVFDAVANALGTTAGLIWALGRDAKSRAARLVCPLVACLLILAAMIPPLWVLGDSLWQKWQMPRLASFEHERELNRWSASEGRMRRGPVHATEGFWALQVDLDAGTYPGVQMDWVPGDWSGYRELLLDVTLQDGPPLDLIVKIHDLEHWKHDRKGHDRFQQVVRLEPGLQTVRISLAEVSGAPRDRQMNMSQISFLQLFTVRLQQPRTFYLDNIRLQ